MIKMFCMSVIFTITANVPATRRAGLVRDAQALQSSRNFVSAHNLVHVMSQNKVLAG
jgi:hypothetical protein